MNSKLFSHLFCGEISLPQNAKNVGIEVETHFIDGNGRPIQLNQSQSIFYDCSNNGWEIIEKRNNLIVVLKRIKCGTLLMYELGRQNLEICLPPLAPTLALELVHEVLNELYKTAMNFNCFPLFEPIIQSNENLLVIPDERDTTWLKLDTAPVLNELAKTASVQFTVDVSGSHIIETINKLNANLTYFLADYPQDKYWREYIKNSPAGYLPERYGGPIFFKNEKEYCQQLAKHKIVTSDGLVDVSTLKEIDYNSFIRSVWWYFRLKRYGSNQCIEIRPLARRTDDLIDVYWKNVSNIIYS